MKKLLDEENPDPGEVTIAYYELEEAAANRETQVLDKAKLSRCYDYCEKIKSEFRDYFDQDTLALLGDIKLKAQITILYPEYPNAQEDIDQCAAEITEQLLAIKPIVDNPDIPLFDEILKMDELAEAYFKAFPLSENTDYICGSTPGFIDFNGYKLYYARFELTEPMLYSERMNGYIFEGKSYNTFYPSETGYLAINTATEDVMTLKEAILQEIVDDDKLFNYLSENSMGFNMYFIGDANNDGILNITDATEVQKAAVGLVETVKTYRESDTVFDFNGDGTVNVTDATEIQKALIS